MSDYAGVTNQLGNSVGLPFSSFSVEEPGMIDLAFAADDLTRMNDMFWLDGIRRDSANWTDGDGAVRWSNGFNVYVRPFRAHVNGTIVFAPQTALAIDQETASSRVDSIIIRRDYNLRTVNVMVLKGTSGSASPPSLTYNAFGLVEYELARVNVTNGMAALSQNDITDMRTVLAADAFSLRPTSADAGKIPMVDSVGGFELSALQVMHVQDQKANNVYGGSFMASAWRTRDLNTVVWNTIPGASLANNRFILPAGTYDIEASAPATMVDRHKARLVNVTDNESYEGVDSFASYDYYGQTIAPVNKFLTIDKNTVFELQHICSSSMPTSGFGLGTGMASNLAALVSMGIFSKVKIKRIG